MGKKKKDKEGHHSSTKYIYGGEFPVRRDIQLGDRIKKRVWWIADDYLQTRERQENAWGTVIYIHPRRHYYTVRFDFARESFNECFPMRGKYE